MSKLHYYDSQLKNVLEATRQEATNDVDNVYYQDEWVVSEPADLSDSADQSRQMCRCMKG